MLPGLDRIRGKRGKCPIRLPQHLIQRILRDLGRTPKCGQDLALALKLLHQIGLQIGTPGYINNLENGGQRAMVVQRMFAGNEMAGSVEQILQPQQRAEAFR